ncbi:MAG: hypothetical protein QNL92_05375, partial [Octadecabacter sp.]
GEEAGIAVPVYSGECEVCSGVGCLIVTLLLDHYTVKSARRALLTTSVIAVLLPSLSISGSGLDFFGVVLELKQETLLTAARLVSFYFLWTFIWLNLASAFSLIMARTTVFLEKRIEVHRDAAHSVDHDPDERGEWRPDIEPWWIHFYTKEAGIRKLDRLFKIVMQSAGLVALFCVEYLPPLLIGSLAVFAPDYANAVLFSTFS